LLGTKGRVLAILTLLLGTAISQTVDVQCSSGDSIDGWRENTAHATTACNMPVLDAGADGLTLDTLVQRLASATTPLLIRGLLDHPDWLVQANTLSNRSTLLNEFGKEQMQLSVGTLLSNGPESNVLDVKKVSFMRKKWGAVEGSVLGDIVEQQVRAGEPKPRVDLGNWLAALREGTAPPDSYVFHNVTDGHLSRALAPLHALWSDASFAEFELQHQSPWRSADRCRIHLTRLGVGGSGSGAPFHDHDVIALNVAFAGRKRWLVTRPCRPNCRIPFYKGGAAVYHPERLLREADLPSTALRMLSEGRDTWDCTQHAGEVIFVPALFLHATINLDESVAVAVQCDDDADPRNNLSWELNALIVHANGAAAMLGPCGNIWDSPFKNDANMQDPEKALTILENLSDGFRGDPTVFLNRPGRDGHAPVDVCVRFGSARVASALAAHGAHFRRKHLVDAQQYGHEELIVFIRSLLKERKRARKERKREKQEGKEREEERKQVAGKGKEGGGGLASSG
jgi:hypothetical protein